jgi:hypothetical protein
MNMQQCVTDKDIEGGQLGRDDEMPKNCEMKDFKMSGNTNYGWRARASSR